MLKQTWRKRGRHSAVRSGCYRTLTKCTLWTLSTFSISLIICPHCVSATSALSPSRLPSISQLPALLERRQLHLTLHAPGDAEKTSSWSGLYIEKWCQFDKELAVMVARNSKGEVSMAY